MTWIGRRAREQDATYRQHWQDVRYAEVAPGALTWVVLGDSAAVGLGAPTVQQSYVSVAAGLIEGRTGRPVRVVNLARSGATASTVLEQQLPELERWPAAEVVSCVVGGNDVAWARRFDVPRFAAAVEAIAQGLPRGAVVGLVPTFGHPPFDGRVRRANTAIRASSQRHGIAVADLSDASGRSWRERTGRLSPDLFHPNARGHAHWARAVSMAVSLPAGGTRD